MTSFLYSQDIDATIESNYIDGFWENSSKIISITSDNNGATNAKIALKTFYTFYYDGVYEVHPSVPVNLVRINDGLYTEYWEKGQAYANLGDPIVQDTEDEPKFKIKIERPMKFDITTALLADGIFWLPKSNTLELSIDETIIRDEIEAYYIDDEAIYRVRYWYTDAQYTDEKVELKLINSSIDESVFIDKYIQIGNTVYTSATGLRTYIRNVSYFESFEDEFHTNNENSILVFGEPYLKQLDITSLEDVILTHNSIPRPARNGLAKFVEPSIYKKLEEMTIEDFENSFSQNY